VMPGSLNMRNGRVASRPEVSSIHGRRSAVSHTGVRALLAITLATFAPGAWAKPRMEITIRQAKEMIEAKGSANTPQLVSTQTASPGDVLQYELTFTNKGDEAAQDAMIDDPIPGGTTFVANSASDAGAQVTYSCDGGKTFETADRLRCEIRLASGEIAGHAAKPNEYTHVRWKLKRVAPGASGVLTFRVSVN
jgi:uncharacterized repeat protein (TIGR01451 family)